MLPSGVISHAWMWLLVNGGLCESQTNKFVRKYRTILAEYATETWKIRAEYLYSPDNERERAALTQRRKEAADFQRKYDLRHSHPISTLLNMTAREKAAIAATSAQKKHTQTTLESTGFTYNRCRAPPRTQQQLRQLVTPHTGHTQRTLQSFIHPESATPPAPLADLSHGNSACGHNAPTNTQTNNTQGGNQPDTLAQPVATLRTLPPNGSTGPRHRKRPRGRPQHNTILSYWCREPKRQRRTPLTAHPAVRPINHEDKSPLTSHPRKRPSDDRPQRPPKKRRQPDIIVIE